MRRRLSKPSATTTDCGIRGLLFDKDGTLIRFHETWMPAYRAVAAEIADVMGRSAMGTSAMGKSAMGSRALAAHLLESAGYDPVRNRAVPNTLLATGSTLDLIQHWIEVAGVAGKLTHAGLCERLAAEVSRAQSPVVKFAPYFRALRNQGLQLGLATMDTESAARQLLADAGAAASFGFIAGADSGYAGKPSADMLEAFAAFSQLPPAAIGVIGDSPHDLEMGRVAGAGLTVGVLTGVSRRADLAPYADAILDSIAELPDLLASLPRRDSTADASICNISTDVSQPTQPSVID